MSIIVKLKLKLDPANLSLADINEERLADAAFDLADTLGYNPQEITASLRGKGRHQPIIDLDDEDDEPIACGETAHEEIIDLRPYQGLPCDDCDGDCPADPEPAEQDVVTELVREPEALSVLDHYEQLKAQGLVPVPAGAEA